MSSRPVVIIHAQDPGPGLALLEERHPDLECHGCDRYDALPALLDTTGAEVLFTIRFAGPRGFPRAAMLGCPTLRWIAVGGSGVDYLLPWDPSRIAVTNSAGVGADMMAEYAIGAMLHFTLGFPCFARAQAERRWQEVAMEPIAGKTLLVLGLGKTGPAVARRAHALGLRTLGVRARPRPCEGVDAVFGIEDLPALWPRADFIVCCVPLLDSTRGLLDAAAFAAMKPDAVLVDVSRGGVIDEAALLDALRAGRLRGAALDVFAEEPLPPEHPLWACDRVVVTPHCSAVYDGWERKSLQMFSDNLSRYRRGEPLRNVVDPARGY